MHYMPGGDVWCAHFAEIIQGVPRIPSYMFSKGMRFMKGGNAIILVQGFR